MSFKDDITVLIPTTAMPSQPSTEVIDRVLDSIKENLPDSEIIIMFDGLKPDLLDKKPAYEEYIQKLLWRANFEAENITPLVFDQWSHQSLMTKQALALVKTPLILFVECDAPLTGEIPWKELIEVVKSGYANVIRFHHEAQIHPEHKFMMLDDKPIDIMGVPLLRTKQWSGRPHLASTEFYRDIASRWDNEPRFIEHIMYGLVENSGWEQWRLHIYAPKGTLVRSLHIDGRRLGAETYDPSAS